MNIIGEHIKKIKMELQEKGELISLEELKQIYSNDGIERELSEDNLIELKPCVQKKYNKRLGLTESNQIIKDSFYDQFSKGNGSELKENIYFSKRWNKRIRKPAKFFNIISSSRLAFELYSWLINESAVQDLKFEYKLPKLNGGNYPNMDVYILHNNTITFIESKYTELANNNYTNIPDAYYKEKGKAYGTKKDDKGNRVLLDLTLSQRYKGEDVIKNKFVPFIENIIQYMKDNKDSFKEKQYDVKQEIAHLLGIAFFILENSKNFKISINGEEIKKIQFYNIVYDFGIKQSQFSLDIIKSANELFQNLIKECNLELEFEYGFKFIQEIIQENKNYFRNAKAYGCDKSVSDQLKQFGINVEELCNESTRS